MKIYPSFHKIEETDRIKPGDIPISYISTDKEEKEILIKKTKEVSKPQEETVVMPYEPFRVRDPYLFNSLGRKADMSSMMQRIGDLFYFVPQNAVEFKPQEFSFSIIYKRDVTFTNDKKYNFKVGCIDGPRSISDKLISIFGDAPRRGLSPSNLSVNNQDMSKESLFNMSIEDADMLFIESHDGEHYAGTDIKIDYDEILEKHTNMWISVDSLGDAIQDAEGPYVYGTSSLYDDSFYELKGYGKSFDLMALPEHLKKYEEYYVFKGESPVAILFSRNKGHLIFSEKGLLENAGAHYKFIYEIMATILFDAYTESPQKTTWITNSIVDHIGLKETEYGYAHGILRMSEIIDLDNIPPGDEYNMISVNTSSSNVHFRGSTRDGIMLFQKLGGQSDPSKDHGVVSVYTTRGTVMLYRKNSLFKVEKEIQVKSTKTPFGHQIEVSPVTSSSLRIFTEETQKISIPPGNGPWALSCKENVFSVKEDALYNEIDDGIKIGTIESVSSLQREHYDMRTQGGGLMDSEKENFNLLDISSIEGRPYREGGALTIKLPKRLASQKEKIENAIGKHISSGDIPIILFE